LIGLPVKGLFTKSSSLGVQLTPSPLPLFYHIYLFRKIFPREKIIFSATFSATKISKFFCAVTHEIFLFEKFLFYKIILKIL